MDQHDIGEERMEEINGHLFGGSSVINYCEPRGPIEYQVLFKRFKNIFLEIGP